MCCTRYSKSEKFRRHSPCGESQASAGPANPVSHDNDVAERDASHAPPPRPILKWKNDQEVGIYQPRSLQSKC